MFILVYKGFIINMDEEIYLTAREASDKFNTTPSSLNSLISEGRLSKDKCKKSGRKILYPQSLLAKLLPKMILCCNCKKEFMQKRTFDKFCTKICKEKKYSQKNSDYIIKKYGDIV